MTNPLLQQQANVTQALFQHDGGVSQPFACLNNMEVYQNILLEEQARVTSFGDMVQVQTECLPWICTLGSVWATLTSLWTMSTATQSS